MRFNSSRRRTTTGPADVLRVNPGSRYPAALALSITPDPRKPLYLFPCHLEWHDKGGIAAYKELLAALDDPDERNRAVAEALLKRRSPRPRPGRGSVDVW